MSDVTKDVVKDAEPVKVSKTDLLFPEDVPAPEPTKEPAEDDPKKADDAADEPKADASEFLDVEKIKSAKVKLKIDGVEEEATVEDVIRRVQFDKHLTLKSQKLAEHEKALLAREKALQESAKPKPAAATNDNDEESIFKDDPLVRKFTAELESLKKRDEERENLVRELQAQTAQTRYQENVKRLAERVEAETGMKDFLDYEPKIRAYIQSLPPEEAAKADTAEAWIGHYTRMKLKDVASMKPDAKKTDGKTATDRAVTKPPRVESGAASGASKSDDWDAKYKKAFETARRMSAEGHPRAADAWAEVTRLKTQSTGE